jgi:hypothetical protein
MCTYRDMHSIAHTCSPVRIEYFEDYVSESSVSRMWSYGYGYGYEQVAITSDPPEAPKRAVHNLPRGGSPIGGIQVRGRVGFITTHGLCLLRASWSTFIVNMIFNALIAK